MRIGESRVSSGAARPPCNHAVQFYEDPEFMSRAAADFLAEGLRNGEPAIAVVRAGNQVAIADYLANQEIDVDGLRASGDLDFLDASDTLARFMVEGMPDGQLLRAAIAHPIRTKLRQRPRPRLRAYGEMVDCLWQAGNREAALRLERLWNELSGELPFSLMCGYRMKPFHGAIGARDFEDICAEHDCVLSEESFRARAAKDT